MPLESRYRVIGTPDSSVAVAGQFWAPKNRPGRVELSYSPIDRAKIKRILLIMTTTTKPEIIATRTTFDGAVSLGGDRLFAGPTIARALPRDVVWVVAGEVCAYEASEVRGLIKAARRAWDGHLRDPRRVRTEDLLRLTRAYAPVSEAS